MHRPQLGYKAITREHSLSEQVVWFNLNKMLGIDLGRYG